MGSCCFSGIDKSPKLTVSKLGIQEIFCSGLEMSLKTVLLSRGKSFLCISSYQRIAPSPTFTKDSFLTWLFSHKKNPPKTQNGSVSLRKLPCQLKLGKNQVSSGSISDGLAHFILKVNDFLPSFIF